jgi:hypothetical protein
MNSESIIDNLKEYIKLLKSENLKIIEDQSISLDKKNAKMKKLLDQKKLAEFTIDSFQRIDNSDYAPMCGMSLNKDR